MKAEDASARRIPARHGNASGRSRLAMTRPTSSGSTRTFHLPDIRGRDPRETDIIGLVTQALSRSAMDGRDLVVRDVAVLDCTGREPSGRHDVRIEDGRIADIEP